MLIANKQPNWFLFIALDNPLIPPSPLTLFLTIRISRKVAQLAIPPITPHHLALISGAVADRMKFGAWMVFAAVWAILVYFPVAHWVFAFDGVPLPKGIFGRRGCSAGAATTAADEKTKQKK